MYDGLKVGDVLMACTQHGYRNYNGEGFVMLEWRPRVVTKVTPKFFFVGEDKHAKTSLPGGTFGAKLFVPGNWYRGEEVPSVATDSAAVEEFKGLLKRLYDAKHSNSQVARVKTLKRQVYFAEKYADLDAELRKELE